MNGVVQITAPAPPRTFALNGGAVLLVWRARERLLGRHHDADDAAHGTLNAVKADLRAALGQPCGTMALRNIKLAVQEILQSQLAAGRGQHERAAGLEITAELRLAVVLLADINEEILCA
jgi:hypothetical protein